MAKHLIDIDEEALAAARAELGTATIRATVNEALRLAIGDRQDRVERHLETLANVQLCSREEAWR
jgi:Arc/MetJ family transcription regulator